MTSLLTALERFLLPNVCVACERAVDPDQPDALVCGVCRARLQPLPAGGCDRCQQPMPPVGPCRFCAEWPRALEAVNSACWLDGPARPVVHHLKYEGYHALGQTLAAVMTRRIPRPITGILVPIPVSPRRRRARGYNQAAMIARALGRLWDLPVRERGLSRAHDRGSQTTRTPAERRENMRAAFTASRRGAMARDLPVILVDDVLTTGATLCAATAALEAAGWARVTAVTFARALPYERRALQSHNS